MQSSSPSLQMSIRSDFAKYMIDQKALPVTSFPPGQRQDPLTGCLLSPALPASLSSPEQLCVLQARLSLPTSPAVTTSNPVTILELTVRGSPIPFTLLFTPSLRKFLPPGPNFGAVQAGFASTAQDQFLFLQFEATRVQVRALLLSKEADLPRMFRESSFFAFTRPMPVVWSQHRGLSLLPAFTVSVTPQAAKELTTTVTVTVRDPAVPQRIVQKRDYLCVWLSLEQGLACLFLHNSSLATVQAMLGRTTALLATRRANTLLLDLGGNPMAVQEVEGLGELALALLRQEPFLVPSSLRDTFSPGQLAVSVQGNAMNQRMGAQPHLASPSCSFPGCSMPPNTHRHAGMGTGVV